MLPLRVQLELPPWTGEVADVNRRYAGNDERVGVAIELARRNVATGDGGPFGAAVFNAHSGRLVAVGVNRVLPEHCSAAHAEMLALMLAQQRAGRHRLHADGGHYVLATSAQPCCQCYGALVWAGIDELVIAATAADVETLAGFDEGPLPADWVGALTQRGIAVHQGVRRDEARAVLASYGAGREPY